MLQHAPELGFAETKPAIELYRGRLVPKVSPQRRHGRLELVLGGILDAWARGKGEVATEWRLYLIPPRGEWSSLVPDVAYISYERLPKDAPAEFREKPTMAPDLAIEILSPDDRTRRVNEKIELYLEFGTNAITVVDPETRSIDIVSAGGRQRFCEGEHVLVAGFDGLTFDVAAVFAETD